MLNGTEKTPLNERGFFYLVRIATLVAPLVTPFGSANTTETRLFAGSKATLPEPVTKNAKVGVASPSMVVVTVGPIALIQAPVAWASSIQSQVLLA